MEKVKKPYKNLVGKRFGRLTVLELVPAVASSKIHTRYKCKCDCGNEKIILGYNLLNGNTQSCGCLSKEMARERQLKHGDNKSRLHVIWCHMRHRCESDWDKAYKYYGARGISVCLEWKSDYAAFRDWAYKNGYEEHLTLERIDVNGNYCPENCRWATKQEQNLNKRNTIRIEYNGEVKTQSEWAEILDCHPQNVCITILALEGRVTKGGEVIETNRN